MVGRSGEVAKSSRSQGACHACQLKPPAWASCCFLDPTGPAQSSPLSLTGSRLLRESWSTWVHPPPTDRASGCPRDTSVSPLQAQESTEHPLPPLTPPQQDQRSNSPQGPPRPGPGSRLYHRPGSSSMSNRGHGSALTWLVLKK